MELYLHNRVLEALRERFGYIFSSENKYPGAPSVIENELTNQSFTLGNLDVIPINLMHNAYLTDVKTVEKEERKKLKGVKVLVVSALRIEPHHSHFNLEEALELYNQKRHT